MGDGDMRRWSLRNPGAEISNNNIPTAMLVQWADRGIIKPGYAISADGETWVPAETLPELGMSWYVIVPGRAPYGPVAKKAAERFIAEGHFPENALVSEDPGDLPISMELPLPLELPQESHLQELEENRKRLVLLEKELRLKNRRIDELRQEAEARQAELNVEGIPDPKALTGELESLKLEHSHLRGAAQEAAEAAAEREREFRQRIHSLETALEAAQSDTPEASISPDESLYAVLASEAELLRQSQEEEERFLDQLRELSRQRLGRFSERLLDIRRLAGENPEQMRANAIRSNRTPTLPTPRKADARTDELEKALAESRSRETELQRQLVAQEGRETQLRAQVGQAERQTLDSLKLDGMLRETAQALERERSAREEEHRENAHIQEQLLRRIEELERLISQSGTPATSLPPPDQRASFGWLRKH